MSVLLVTGLDNQQLVPGLRCYGASHGSLESAVLGARGVVGGEAVKQVADGHHGLLSVSVTDWYNARACRPMPHPDHDAAHPNASHQD